MKKIIVVLLSILFCVVFCYSKDFSSEVFKDCFKQSDKTYEFNIRNPLFADKFYVKKINKLKNKIIKETLDSYEVDGQGKKSYSDSYVKDIICMYYFFDSEGRLIEKYYYNGNVNGDIFYKQKETYTCLQNSYEIMIQDFVNKKEKKIVATIEKKNDGIVLLFDKLYDNYSEIHFSKDKISKKKTFGKNMASVKDLLIDNNRIQEEQYNISEGKKSYWGISFYENDCMMEEKRFVPSGDELYKYELDDTGHGFYTYFKEGNTSEKIIKKEVYRRFNSIGFLEYEEKKPYNSEVGDYSYTTVEILSEPDELFNSQFKFSD